MANVFIHFEPIGPVGGDLLYGTTDLPPYLIPGSPEEDNWRSRNPNGHTIMKSQTFTTGTTEAHKAAMEGDLQELKDYVELHEDVVNSRDSNGWTALHEGVRRGNVEVVRFLLERGSDVNLRTESTKMGGTPLYWAQKEHGDDHPMIDLLKEYHAKYIAPGEEVHANTGGEL
jgi:prolyl 4-hydroxylase